MSETQVADPETTTTDETTEPEISEEGGVLSRMARPRYKGPERVSSMDLEDPATKLKLFNAGSAKSTPLRDVVGKAFQPVHYLAERVTIRVKDKTDRRGCRLTLWDEEGHQFFTSSESIITAFDRLIAFFGDDLAKTPHPVMITESVTGGGNKWYNVACEPTNDKPKTKK